MLPTEKNETLYATIFSILNRIVSHANALNILNFCCCCCFRYCTFETVKLTETDVVVFSSSSGKPSVAAQAACKWRNWFRFLWNEFAHALENMLNGFFFSHSELFIRFGLKAHSFIMCVFVCVWQTSYLKMEFSWIRKPN